MKKAFLLIPLALILMPAGIARAHTTEASWEVPIGKYTADVGYDPPQVAAGLYERFDFTLWVGATTSGEVADYSQIWIRILRGSDTLLATGIWTQPIGPTTLLYEFPEPGSYTLETSFRDADGNDLAVQTFPITVAGSSDIGPLYGVALDVALIVAGLLLGALLGWYLPSRIRNFRKSSRISERGT
jgi:hypothetical protein